MLCSGRFGQHECSVREVANDVALRRDLAVPEKRPPPQKAGGWTLSASSRCGTDGWKKGPGRTPFPKFTQPTVVRYPRIRRHAGSSGRIRKLPRQRSGSLRSRVRRTGERSVSGWGTEDRREEDEHPYVLQEKKKPQRGVACSIKKNWPGFPKD